MCTPRTTQPRVSNITFPRLPALALLTLILIPAQTPAQQQIAQDGRLFDANPQIGASRYNFARPTPPLLGGNPYATGNVGRGLALRSFSPIDSPTAFRASLGTTALSNFLRDSISTGYAYSPGGGLTPTLFYDPVRTAPNVSYLTGGYDFQPGTPGQSVDLQTGATAPTGFRADAGFPQYGTPPARPQAFDSARQSALQQLGQPLNAQLSSGIFGLTQPQLPGPLSDLQLQPNLTYVPEPRPDPFAADDADATARTTQDPLDLRAWPEPYADAATPLDVLMRENARRLLTERTQPTLQQPGDLAEPSDTGLGQMAALPGPALGPIPAPGFDVQPGGDVFTDMQLALEISRNPQAEWLSEIFEADGMLPGQAAADSSTYAIDQQVRSVEAAEDFLVRVFEAPLQTFVGEDPTAVNDELRKAETAMAMGRYYDAVQHYQRVRVLDPANPLPLIGLGHALLAAGEYVSAANSLINGLARFPELARFQVDLKALMGGGEIVDIRRADLIKQLARNEDTQLRFLLGYLEVHAGLIEFGIQHLEEAARQAEPGSLIRRYPAMIRHKAWLSPEPLPGEPDQLVPGQAGDLGREPATPKEESK